MLNDAQKKAIVEQDKSAKNSYLTASPSLANAGVKTHPKFIAYTSSIGGH